MWGLCPSVLQLIIVPIYWAKRPGEQATVLAAAERIQEVRPLLGGCRRCCCVVACCGC